MKHPIPVPLCETDRASLQTFIHAGKANARTFTRARVLLKAAEGWTDQQMCDAFDISRNTSIRVRQVYLEGVDYLGKLNHPLFTSFPRVSKSSPILLQARFF
jgi:hypothetical protein